MDECGHPIDLRRVVSDVVIYAGTRNDSAGAHDYEIVREVVVCQQCGSFVEQRDVERSVSRGRLPRLRDLRRNPNVSDM